ncbi:MAG TPA: hypothetical protein VH330_11615 [Candidatus Udaeobacter sp.]|jgi:hypothetical protein
MKRTLLAINIAVFISMMLAPHTGRGLLRFANYVHGPFFIMPQQIAVRQLFFQTIIFAVAAAVIVNLLPRRK